MNSRLSNYREILLGVFYFNRFSEKHLKTYFSVLILKEIFKGFVKVLWKEAAIAFLATKFTSITILLQVNNKNLNAYPLSQYLDLIIELFNNI